MNNNDKLENVIRHDNIYKKMVEEIQDYAIILLNKDGYIQNWNKGAQKIKLYTEEEIIGKHFSIFYQPEDLINNLPQKLLYIAETTGRASHEGWRVRKDGTRFWGSITITAIHDDDNNVIGFCKVTRDLTNKKIAEDKLRMSEERYHKMVAEVQDYAIIMLNVDGVVENWNAGAQKIKGYSGNEIIGKSFEIFYPKEDRERGLPKTLLNMARQTGRAIHEGWRVRKDGTKFWGSITITALHGNDGEVIGFSKVTRDLTEKKITEDKLAAYTEELEIQNRELEQFAYVASHDLQEPLRKIQIFTDLITENYGDREFTDRYFDKLRQSARRMAQLVKSLLNYSRLSKDKFIVDKVDLDSVLSEVKQDLELLIAEKKAAIISQPLPTVPGNRIQLEQLFSNLIGNSLKFCQEAPVIKISCSIVTESEKNLYECNLLPYTNYYLINFEDNGIGFENQYRETIFSLFQRLHGKETYAGTGIGLALCRKIVENHNGFIIASGEPGKGARFSIFLPISN